ncbi:MAG: type II toxin-antitoxin system VapC family toxin [Syntrophomonadaceae bacterium]|nr:type II toxin-antitoxin system VapC family toxin [Syntrophomonadaceae bacterium]
MKVLLDTHAFLWWVVDSSDLSPRAREVISDGENQLFLSAASGWEIAIKTRLGKLRLPGHLDAFISEQLATNFIDVLPVSMHHALYTYTLPEHHRDPFDRMLVAQAKLENLPIVTADPQIASYPVQVIW